MLLLSEHLFWDVDRETVDPVHHGAWLVRRVLEYGRWDDFLALVAFYGKGEVGAMATTLRSLDQRALHFCSAYFGIPLSEFRCCTPIVSQLPS